MNKIHVWIGFSNKKEDDFYDYFDLTSFNESEEGEEFKVCGFAKDINKKIYNEDFIGIYFDEEDDALKLALDELPDPKLAEELYKVCLQNNIEKANAMFYYTDARLQIMDVAKKYNELKYLGCYDW